MKRNLIFTVLMLSCIMTMSAIENEGSLLGSVAPDESIDEIAKRKSLENRTIEDIAKLRRVWDKTTFFNISLNNTKLSSDEFPSITGPVSNEFKRDIGLGLQMGKTFYFHKQPLGSVLFIGLDYTWMDFNFNTYKAAEQPVGFVQKDNKNYYMPWHNKKTVLDYGMSLGPSLTLFPFTSLSKPATDKIRLNLYFHVGYDIGLAMIQDVESSDGKTKTENALGHGLFTSFGASLTWDFVGIGFDIRNDGNIKYKHLSKDYDNGTFKMKQKTPRIYLQFRF